MRPKLIVIVGPTATGKSDLAVHLALKYNGEVISADSRQVYRGLDIGTGKITKKEMRGVPHHLLDVVSPKKIYTVAQFKEKVDEIISDITRRDRLPILCGGTGFYIDAVVNDTVFPDVPANPALRAKLAQKTVSALFQLLQKKDPTRARTIDRNNKVRLVRALEIVAKLGSVPALDTSQKGQYDVLKIGIAFPDPILKSRIEKRLLARVKGGMVTEARALHTHGVSFRRMESLGLEYRYLAQFLQKKITRTEMIALLNQEIWRFAKRQMTWFKRDKTIIWLNGAEVLQAEKLVRNFLKKQL